MRIIVNPDKDIVDIVRANLKKDPHCPCKLEKTDDTICMCKEFREQTFPGECHCGLYIKVSD